MIRFYKIIHQLIQYIFVRNSLGIILYFSVSVLTVNGQNKDTLNSPPPSRAMRALYINSYAPTYRWANELTRGIQAPFEERADITLDVEYLDSKRFSKTFFEKYYQLFKTKYSEIEIDVIITSDNNALDFLLQFPELFPSAPVVFCGIGNVEDYVLPDRFYGLREEEFFRESFDLALALRPDVKTLYLIYDQTESSLVNIRAIRALESEFAGKVKFEYLLNENWNETLEQVKDFDPNGVIATTDVYSRNKYDPISVKHILTEITEVAKIPVIDGREGAMGTGILGGVFTNGYNHGRSAAKMAIRLLDDPEYVPEMKIFPDTSWYAFDYNILKNFDVDMSKLPENATIVNKPEGFLKYLKYILILGAFIVIESIVITMLLRNIQLRRKAEEDILDKLDLLKSKNQELENANTTIKEMFSKQEELTISLQKSIGQLEVAREQAEHSSRLKTEFLNNLTHEIRTPMNGIIGFSEMLNRENVTSKNVTYFTGIIQKSSNQLLKIIDDILEISNLDTNQSIYNEEKFDLNELLDEVVAQNSSNTDMVSVKLQKGLSGTDSIILSDPQKLKKILSNLLDNAVKFTHEGDVEIGYSLANDILTFYVKDTGIGIEASNKEIIFDRFRQENVEIARNYGGLGLGLSIVQENAKLIGGEISFKSAKGKGSSFYLDLTYKPGYKVTSQDKVNLEVGLDVKKYKVLVADDEFVNFEFIKMLLKIEEKAEFNVLHACNGKEAVEICEGDSEIDLVLMDIKMPIMNGHEATRKIKSLHPNLPVIVQTAYSTENDRKLALNHGCDDFLVKPIHADQLMKVMFGYLE